VVDADDDDDGAVCIASGVNTVSMHALGTLRQQIAAAYEEDAFYSGVIDYLRAPSDNGAASSDSSDARVYRAL
jgi:hypothetical protein